MGDYTGYVTAAYAITGVVIIGLVVFALVDRRRARTALQRAERTLARQQQSQTGAPSGGGGR